MIDACSVMRFIGYKHVLAEREIQYERSEIR